MNAYMAYDGGAGSSEGAALVFAFTVKHAKVVVFPTIRSWFDTEWVDLRVRRLTDHVDYLIGEADPDKYLAGTPHVIDNPKVCPGCELWGGGPIIDGRCEYCLDDDWGVET